MIQCGVYKLEFPDGRFYIGSSKNVCNRLRGHEGALKRGVHKNYRVQRAYDKNKTMAGKLLLICSESDLIFYEQIVMNGLNPTLNMALIAGREAAGRVVSAETRAKHSAIRKGQVGTRLGHKATPETIERLSKSHLGYRLKPETIEKIRIKSTGRKHTPEAKAKMSLIAQARRHTEETKKKIAEISSRRRHSEKAKALVSASLLGNKRMVGLKRSPESLAKQSASMKAWHARRREQCCAGSLQKKILDAVESAGADVLGRA